MITRQPNGFFPKADFWKLTNYRGHEVSRSIIEEVKPEVLVVAAAGMHTVPKSHGISKSYVMTSRDLHLKLETYLKLFGIDHTSFTVSNMKRVMGKISNMFG
jgi:hypothetical protein